MSPWCDEFAQLFVVAQRLVAAVHPHRLVAAAIGRTAIRHHRCCRARLIRIGSIAGLILGDCWGGRRRRCGRGRGGSRSSVNNVTAATITTAMASMSGAQRSNRQGSNSRQTEERESLHTTPHETNRDAKHIRSFPLVEVAPGRSAQCVDRWRVKPRCMTIINHRP